MKRHYLFLFVVFYFHFLAAQDGNKKQIDSLFSYQNEKIKTSYINDTLLIRSYLQEPTSNYKYLFIHIRMLWLKTLQRKMSF